MCIVVARQNGKTTLMMPIIIQALRDGKRIVHIAQNRNLPRQMFDLIAGEICTGHRTSCPRAAGQDHLAALRRRAGGSQAQQRRPYRIAAANQGGARGFTNDIVIVDELREMVNNEIPERGACRHYRQSDDPQIALPEQRRHR